MIKKISILQQFGIILVVLGHANNIGQNIPYITTWIYSFHMPLFIFISGYLLDYTQNSNYLSINIKNLLLKKIKRFFIPYFFIQLGIFFPKYLFSKYAIRPINFSFYELLLSFLYPDKNIIGFYWFLPTLFLIIILSLFILRKYNIKILFIFSIMCLFFLNYYSIAILNIKGVMYYIIYFCLGIFYRRNENKIELCLEKYFIFSFLLVNIILIINVFFIEKIEINLYEIIFYKVFIGMIGILLSILLSIIYCRYNFNFFKIIGNKTYTIYLLSWFPQVGVRILGYQVLNLNSYLVVILSVVLGLFIPILINEVLKNSKIKFLRYLIGA